MPYEQFHDRFPDLAERETRTITLPPGPAAQPLEGTYAFVEMFCNEPGCDCRRVFWYVVSPGRPSPQAVIAYGWEDPSFYANWLKRDDPDTIADLTGPILNHMSPQSPGAPAILDLVRDVLLADHAYIERVKSHYRLFRAVVDAPRPANTRVGTRKPKKARKRGRR